MKEAPVAPRMPGSNANRYTSGEYCARCPSWHQDDSSWKVDQLMQTVPAGFWQGMATAPVRVVDIGCGAGGVLGHLGRTLAASAITIDGLGIEIADDALALARQAWPELAFQRRAVHELEDRYDVGLLMDIVEHVENPWQLIRDAMSRCRFMIFHIPLDDSFLTEVANLYAYKARSMGHIHFHTRRKALWLLESSGLEVLSQRLTPAFSVQSSRGLSAKHRMMSYPRKILAAISPATCARCLGGMSLMVVTRPQETSDRF